MRTPPGRQYAQRTLRDDVNSLSYREYKQLRRLKSVHDNPSITSVWGPEECNRLVELGFAKYVPLTHTYTITLRGLDALALVGV